MLDSCLSLSQGPEAKIDSETINTFFHKREQRLRLSAGSHKRQRKPSRGKQRHKLTLPDCELEGLLLPPVSQISKLHTLLSHGPAWANPPGNAGQSGLGGIRARLLPITALPT